MDEEAVVKIAENLRAETHAMCRKTVEMLRLTWEGFRKQETEPLQPAETLCREVHQREKTLTELVMKKLAGQADLPEADQKLFFIPMHLERIGDNTELLIRAIKTMIQEGIPFSERAMKEINLLFEKTIELVECVQDVIITQNRILIKHILEEGQRYEELANEYAVVHQQRLIEGVCIPKASSVYLAILDDLRGIEWHTRQIAQKLATVPVS